MSCGWHFPDVLRYKGKSGAVPQKVLVYCLFWVSPDFFPHTKKLVQTAFVWVKTLVTLYGCRQTYGTPRVLWDRQVGLACPGIVLLVGVGKPGPVSTPYFYKLNKVIE